MFDLGTVQGGTGRKRTSFVISQEPFLKTLLPHLTRPTTKAEPAQQRIYQPSGEGQTASWAGTFWVICKARLASASCFEICWERVPAVQASGSLERSLSPSFSGCLCDQYMKKLEGTNFIYMEMLHADSASRKALLSC